MRSLLMKERLVGTEYGSYRLQYRMHEIKIEEEKYYGISVFQYKYTDNKEKIFDQAIIRAFSESMKEAADFFETIFRELVFPVHLYSVADDWCYSSAFIR